MTVGESEDSRYVWNEDLGVVDTQSEKLEIKDGKLEKRTGFWMVFVFLDAAPTRINDVALLAKLLSKTARFCKVEINTLEVREVCLFLKIYVDEDVKVIDFAECIIGSNKETLRAEHFVTSIRKPTDFEINEYIKGLRNR